MDWHFWETEESQDAASPIPESPESPLPSPQPVPQPVKFGEVHDDVQLQSSDNNDEEDF